MCSFYLLNIVFSINSVPLLPCEVRADILCYLVQKAYTCFKAAPCHVRGEYQVIIIYAATKKYLLDVEVDSIRQFEKELFDFIDTKYSEVPKAIREEKQMSEETEGLLIKAIEEFKKEFRG